MVQKPVLNNVKKETGQNKVRPVWNNAMRVNHQNFSNSRRNFVPIAVLTKSGIVPVGVARPINTVVPKSFVNAAKTRPNAFRKSHSLSRRPFYQQKALKNKNLNDKVNTNVAKIGLGGLAVTVDTINDGEQQITVTVDGKIIAITEASVRRHLQLADADGISSLPNTEIFDQLTLMGYVSNDDKLTFQKGVHIPLFDTMLIHDQPGQGEGPTLTVESQHTPIASPPTSQPTTSQPMSSQEQPSQVPITEPITDSFTTSHPTKTQTPSLMPDLPSLQRQKLVKKVKHLEAKLKSTTENRKARMTDDDLQKKSMIEEIYLAKILADASRERVKTYTRRRSTDSSRDSTTGGLFSTGQRKFK
ncbi:hypothetical protein Tco_0446718 [Tanacetum coccineum]